MRLVKFGDDNEPGSWTSVAVWGDGRVEVARAKTLSAKLYNKMKGGTRAK